MWRHCVCVCACIRLCLRVCRSDSGGGSVGGTSSECVENVCAGLRAHDNNHKV